ncbi:uncharacterized protein (TIGR02145 family) [Runella defluvii]|uniref:Uncharacterized protein (TIGR02145 family) n=1 Tax=Runella defluvii TaxID=370973 RepID=A0A7W5ZRE1_9BACT|nr:hypothetical protein [Runella defluvii]MBB3842257.1 uncharacterized protein (TIGR02145 family) [Runella defluvii]
MKHFNTIHRTTLFLLMVLLTSLSNYAQNNVALPTQCTTCIGGPCTAVIPIFCEAAATISAGGSVTSNATGGTGGTITWAITPTTGVSSTSGSGVSTGAITFATAGTYTVTFISTNSSLPVGCSTAAISTCSRTITVGAATAAASIAACSSGGASPISFSAGVAYTGKVTVSYTGGNGGSYAAGSVPSVGATGFTASWDAGTLSTGDGTITINIAGTSAKEGSAFFTVSIAGKSIAFAISSCGANVLKFDQINGSTIIRRDSIWKAMLCHNLGADITADPHNLAAADAWRLNGAYIQWGRRGPNITGNSAVDWQTAPNDFANGFVAAPTASNYSTYGPVVGSTWAATYAPSDLPYTWTDAKEIKTANEPCPAGFHVPTIEEWSSIYSTNGAPVRVGPWTYTNQYNSGLRIGSKLTLPAAGLTSSSNTIGFLAHYWANSPHSSDRVDPANSYAITYSGASYPYSISSFTGGKSIRCIQD